MRKPGAILNDFNASLGASTGAAGGLGGLNLLDQGIPGLALGALTELTGRLGGTGRTDVGHAWHLM